MVREEPNSFANRFVPQPNCFKRELWTHLGPKCKRYLPVHLAGEITKALRLSKWRLVKDPPSPPHSTFGRRLDEE